MARPSKRTPEREAKILDLLRAGNTRSTAALACGVGYSTFCEWVAKFPELAEQVKAAEAAAETLHVQNILNAASKGSWQASAWWLERRQYDSWGRKDRIAFVTDAKEMARNAGVSEDAAVAQAEQILRELRSKARA